MTINTLLSFGFTVLIFVAYKLYRDRKSRNKMNELHFKKMASLGTVPGHKNVDFFFYFKSEADAWSAAQQLTKWDFTPRIEKVEGEFKIECTQYILAEKYMLDGLCERYEKLAKDNNGVFDGWGTEV